MDLCSNFQLFWIQHLLSLSEATSFTATVTRLVWHSIISYLLKTRHYPYLFMRGEKFWSFSQHALGQNSGRNVGIWKVTLTNCTELLVWVKNIPKLSQMRRLDPEHNSRLGRLTAWVDEGGWGVRGIIICLKWLRHTW